MVQLIKRKLAYTFWSVLYAYGIFFITTIISNFAGDRTSFAVILNIVMIIVFVIVEKIEEFMLRKVEAKEMQHNLIFKLLMNYFKGPSFKSAMYLFYIVILIYSALAAADPKTFTFFPYEYLLSVRYGILVLIAADKFMAQVTKDITNDYKNEGDNTWKKH